MTENPTKPKRSRKKTGTLPELSQTGVKIRKSNKSKKVRNDNIAKDIVRMTLEGAPKNEIDGFVSERYGIAPSTVQNLRLSNKEINDKLKNVVSRYAEEAETIAEEFMTICKDNSDRAVQLSAIKEYHNIVSLAPSKQPSMVMNNIINAQGASFVIHRGTLEAIAKFATSKACDIFSEDVTPVEISLNREDEDSING